MVRWTGGEDRQTSGSRARRRFWRARGRGAELLTWLQTGLYLSPGLFRIFSSCLWLKLDTPMDLVGPASLHFSRTWEGGVVDSHLEWVIEQELVVKNISNHSPPSRVTLDYQEGKKRSWYKKKNYCPHLRKTPESHITWKEKDACLHCPKFSSSVPLCEHIINGFLSTTQHPRP